jgi:poly(3-hydroxybutyrate) depolymerase
MLRSLVLAALIVIGPAAARLHAVERTEGPLTCPMGRQYWLGFPHGYDPDKTYWLVAVAHGAGGTGDSMKSWQMAGPRTDYIVVSPSYPKSEAEGYFQGLGGNADAQLIGLFKALHAKYKLHDQVFLYGFSAGSQFSHRFTMVHPELVVGCSAHSGGSWGPHVNPAAMGVPMAFSCGLNDVQPSVPGALPRVEEAQKYFALMQQQGMCAKLRYWEGVGHSKSRGSDEMTAEAYELATTGLFPHQRTAIDAELAKVDALITADDVTGAKRAILALAKFKLPPVKPKTPKLASLTPDELTAQRAEFVASGVGGASKLGRDIWIDDRNENQDGWMENPTSRTALQARYRDWMKDQVAGRLAKIKPEPAKGKK